MNRAHIPPARLRALTPVYDVFCRALGLGRSFRGFQLDVLSRFTPRSVLEVGCGTGELLRSMSRRFPGSAVTGIDPDPDALAIARRKLGEDRLRANLVPARAEALPFEAASFDLVVSSLMLHHLATATKRRALAECRRVLAPGGTFALFDLGVPRSRLLRFALWPLRFNVLEEQADNFRGLVPGLVKDAAFEIVETFVYGGVVYAWIARAS